MTKALRSIALSKEWAELRSLDLTQRLESGDLLTQEETVDFVNWLRLARTTSVSQSEESQPPAVVAPDTHYTRVLDARAYLGWRAGQRLPFTGSRSRRVATTMPLRSWPTGNE